jgi:hypothetical protein
LFDPDPINSNQFFGQSGDVWDVSVARKATLWGAAIEGRRDAVVAGLNTTLRGGLGYRRIETDLSLLVNSQVVAGKTLAYGESLDVGYLGAYVGYTIKANLGSGWTASIDGEGGLYWAHASFDGNYNANIPGSPANTLSQALSLDKDAAAAIFAAKVALDKDFGGWIVGVFGRAEYYTRAPMMSYNTVDDLFFQPPVLRNGTSIQFSHASTLGAGARVTVPFR